MADLSVHVFSLDMVKIFSYILFFCNVHASIITLFFSFLYELNVNMIYTLWRWDDLSAKPPAGGTNTVSTETEITTTELLKRREVGADGLRSEYLVRKIVVPLGVPEKPKGMT